MNFSIPIYKPAILGNEKKYVNECLDSTWISSKGDFVNKFENSFAEYIDVKYATSVSNGTLALHLALLALGIGSGDEIIVPTLTYIASVNCITYTGATPVFVDSLADTWQMNCVEIRNKITSKTKAIIAVHLYGHPCDMAEIVKIAQEFGLYLIEDCAEAIGSKYKNVHVGTFGHVATFSFFGNKTITTGEGGMLVTNDHELFNRAVHIKGQGLARNREYWHDIIGYNFRMTNICAAIGLAQLEQISIILDRKRILAEFYKSAFLNCEIQFHAEHPDVYHSYWMCSILVKSPSIRENVRASLASSGIETRPLFSPIHTMPMYIKDFYTFPIAEDLGSRGINLPSFPLLEQYELETIVSVIKKSLC